MESYFYLTMIYGIIFSPAIGFIILLKKRPNFRKKLNFYLGGFVFESSPSKRAQEWLGIFIKIIIKIIWKLVKISLFFGVILSFFYLVNLISPVAFGILLAIGIILIIISILSIFIRD